MMHDFGINLKKTVQDIDDMCLQIKTMKQPLNSLVRPGAKPKDTPYSLYLVSPPLLIYTARSLFLPPVL